MLSSSDPSASLWRRVQNSCSCRRAELRNSPLPPFPLGQARALVPSTNDIPYILYRYFNRALRTLLATRVLPQIHNQATPDRQASFTPRGAWRLPSACTRALYSQAHVPMHVGMTSCTHIVHVRYTPARERRVSHSWGRARPQPCEVAS